MKKMSKTIFVFILGLVASFAINVAAEAVISSGSVSYSNTTVSAALDELFSAVEINEKIVEIEERINTIESEGVLEKAYPVGSIYISTSSTNPSNIIGGTWESFGMGRTLVGAGIGTDSNSTSITFANGSTGGEYNHLLTVNEMPQHSHKQVYELTGYSGWTGTTTYYTFDGYRNPGSANTAVVNTAYTMNTGGSQYHNNIQPYITVHMWKRTA